jgi:hypothetical protein
MSKLDVVLVTFATQGYEKGQLLLEEIARRSGWNYASYNPRKLLEIDPYFNSRPMASIERGFGLWSWKPTIILHELSRMSENQVLFYLDSGDLFLPNIVDIYSEQLTNSPFLLFEGGGTIREYTKRSVLEYFHLDGFLKRNKRMVEAGASFWRNTPVSRDFVQEWKSVCQKFELISDPSGHERQHSNFIAHRHDQSLLTALSMRTGAPVIKANKRRSFQCNVMEA